jgi:pheromone shutdown protein TraB
MVVPMPSNQYISDPFISNLALIWNNLMVFIFIAPVYRLIMNIVNEKQQRIRELMKMMGLTESPYWFSWFTYYIIVITFLSFVMTLLMIPVIKFGNLFLIFVYFWLYGMSLFSYSIFITSFFSNGKVASIAGSLVLFFSSFLI